MTPTRLMNILAAVTVLAWIVPGTASAEGNMGALDGEWAGSGTERDTPFQSMQKITCQSKIRADQHHMSNEISCTTQSGVRKTTHTQVTLEGTRLSGSVLQTRTLPSEPMQSRKGTVKGVRTGNSAVTEIQFSGLMMPAAKSHLIVHDASSYSIRVEAMGAVMMDVKFKRVGPPKEANKEATQASQAQ
ncbi:MAG TPA: hypothetical protein VIH98_02935 [Xanthobacteraceae bacterium]|jgi:hypothetical protein